MSITVELPDDIATQQDGARAALEAFAIEGYRSGALMPYQIRTLLGLETRYELDGFLKAHQVWDFAYGIKDFEQDLASLDRLEASGLLRK